MITILLMIRWIISNNITDCYFVCLSDIASCLNLHRKAGCSRLLYNLYVSNTLPLMTSQCLHSLQKLAVSYAAEDSSLERVPVHDVRTQLCFNPFILLTCFLLTAALPISSNSHPPFCFFSVLYFLVCLFRVCLSS